MASGHLTHEIAICQMVPRLYHIRTLAGHSRTPWCLAFDPCRPHLLYSGCLAGTVHKWDVRVRSISSWLNVVVSLPIIQLLFVTIYGRRESAM